MVYFTPLAWQLVFFIQSEPVPEQLITFTLFGIWNLSLFFVLSEHSVPLPSLLPFPR